MSVAGESHLEPLVGQELGIHVTVIFDVIHHKDYRLFGLCHKYLLPASLQSELTRNRQRERRTLAKPAAYRETAAKQL